jgi:hypothetical protein
LIEQGKEDGSVSPNIDVEAASELMLYLALGMRVAGKIADNQVMEATLKMAMKILD